MAKDYQDSKTRQTLLRFDKVEMHVIVAAARRDRSNPLHRDNDSGFCRDCQRTVGLPMLQKLHEGKT